MGNLRALSLATALLGSFGGAALSADLPAPPGLPMAPAMADPVEYNGWYLRGDVGIGKSGTPGLNYDLLRTGSVPSVAGGGYRDPGSFISQDMQDQGLISFGAGYAWNNWLRTDATLEYRAKAQFNGIDQYVCHTTLMDACYPNAVPAGYTINSQWRGNVSSMVAMANVYADLGTWNNLTPYIGAGVGISRNTTTGISELGTVYTDPALKGGNYYMTDAQYSNGASKTNFAWALMTGLSYNVSQNLKLELGYRYINLGKAVTGYETQQPTSYQFVNLKTKSLTAQDFRLGMRWMLGTPTATVDAPLVRKF